MEGAAGRNTCSAAVHWGTLLVGLPVARTVLVDSSLVQDRSNLHSDLAVAADSHLEAQARLMGVADRPVRRRSAPERDNLGVELRWAASRWTMNEGCFVRMEQADLHIDSPSSTAIIGTTAASEWVRVIVQIYARGDRTRCDHFRSFQSREL